MTRSALSSHLVILYREYLGVAADFVIEDALAHIDSHPEWRPHPQLLRAQFLTFLEQITPPEVPFATLRSQIANLVAGSDL